MGGYVDELSQVVITQHLMGGYTDELSQVVITQHLMGGYTDELSQVVITQHRPQAAHLSVRTMTIVKVKITNVHSNAARIVHNNRPPPPPTHTHTHTLFEV